MDNGVPNDVVCVRMSDPLLGRTENRIAHTEKEGLTYNILEGSLERSCYLGWVQL